MGMEAPWRTLSCADFVSINIRNSERMQGSTVNSGCGQSGVYNLFSSNTSPGRADLSINCTTLKNEGDF
jgi:hypothetical protein